MNDIIEFDDGTFINADCMDVMKDMQDKQFDLCLTDPPYLIKNTTAGGKSRFAKSFQKMNNEIKEKKLTEGIDLSFCDEIIRLQKKINSYIWCNKAQILDYLKFFVEMKNCSFDILCWQKDNAPPTFNNKYLTDKEYCLYFRKGGYCQPVRYENAKTIFNEPLNIKDKNKYGHPTIKPLKIFDILISNSTKEGDSVLDCFSGSGTTAVACHRGKRRFVCIEKDKEYFEMSVKRYEEEIKQMELF